MNLPKKAKLKEEVLKVKDGNPVKSIYDLSFKTIDGAEKSLSQFKDKKILFVNVASKCGFTKQYEDLEQLYQNYKDNLVIIGFPCNQFGNQESGTSEEIKQFCSLNFGVSFVLSEKIKVKGSDQHPIYSWLTKESENGKKDSKVKWNFQKYLVNEKGSLVDYFYSTTNPQSDSIIKLL